MTTEKTINASIPPRRYLSREEAAAWLGVTKTKNGEDRAIRLTERAKQVLKDLRPKDIGPVFTYNGKSMTDIKHSFDKARQDAGVEDFRFHDLRHTFASRLVQQGVPLYEVMHAPDWPQELFDGAALFAPRTRLSEAGHRGAQFLWHNPVTVVSGRASP